MNTFFDFVMLVVMTTAVVFGLSLLEYVIQEAKKINEINELGGNENEQTETK
jgi:hypothetical protein